MGNVLPGRPGITSPRSRGSVRAAGVRPALTAHQVGAGPGGRGGGARGDRRREVKVEAYLFRAAPRFSAAWTSAMGYSPRPDGHDRAWPVGVPASLPVLPLLFTGRRLPKRPEDDKQGESTRHRRAGLLQARTAGGAVVAWPAGGRSACGRLVAVPDRRPGGMSMNPLRVRVYRGQVRH